ncbi:hypothetical protein [Mycobacteroides abscessus]|uniref:hypothetical protein n=1 Tax=Mycobacteroides abscessus TaxID=36809 RepID=UPI001F3951CD|nr:hypothetical protein [Mycobacteroides abscessus]
MPSVERQARREAVRKHHPDAGGSAEALMAALQALSEERAARRAAVPDLARPAQGPHERSPPAAYPAATHQIS